MPSPEPAGGEGSADIHDAGLVGSAVSAAPPSGGSSGCSGRNVKKGMEVMRRTAMCGVITSHSPRRFQQVSRSLRIAGQSTTVRLEHAFWAVLDEIAEDEGTTTARLVSTLHEEALEFHDEML